MLVDRVHACALPKFDRNARRQHDPRRERARLWIRDRRKFTNAAGNQPSLLRPQFDLHRLADPERGDALFGNADLHLAIAIGGQRVNRLSGRDHLAGFGLPLGDHPVGWRAQVRVAGLVAGDLELRIRLLYARSCGLVRILAALELRAAHHLLVGEYAIAFALGLRELKIGLRRGQLRTRRFDLQANIAGVELGQQLSALHSRTHIDEPTHQMSADLKRERRFFARTHIAGECLRARVKRPGMHDQRRPQRI